MCLENFDEELRIFGENAKEDGFTISRKSGALVLTDHSTFYDCEIYWRKGNEKWEIRNLETDERKHIMAGKLKYGASTFY